MRRDFSDIKVIGFDLDQTLYPKSPLIDEAIQIYIYHKIAEQRGCSLDEASTLFNDLYQHGRGLSGSKSLKALGIEGGGEIVQEALENAGIASFLKHDPATADLITRLGERYRSVDVLTGSNAKNAGIKMAKLDLPAALFGRIITSDDHAKSNGDAYKHWMEYYPDLGPSNFLYVGDRVRSDYEVPRGLGISSILLYVTEQDDALECLQLGTLQELGAYLL